MFSPIIFNNKVFRDIVIPGVYNYYLVSNYGNVFNKSKNRYSSLQLCTNGYIAVSLSGLDGRHKHLAHRLVMMAFHPIIGQELLYVNHKDGCKINNYEGNLEWTTPSENDYHALRTGLRTNFLENHPNSKLTNDQVHQICKCIEAGMNSTEIKNVVQGLDNINIRNIVYDIKHKNTWTRISDQYNI